MQAISSQCGLAAFVTLVPTPVRSAGGWTRGMPPPSRTPAAARPLVRRTHRVAACSWQMTAAAGPHAASTSSPSSGAVDDPESTVHAYVTDGASTAVSLAQKNDERSTLLQNAGDCTQGVHGGERVKGGKKQKAILDAIQTPIVQSSTFTFHSTQDCIDYNTGDYASFEYGRYGNPTTRAAEEKLMTLDRAEDALFSSSGMNSATTMLLALVPENGHIVVTTDCYRRTRQFVNTLLPKMGIRTTVIDPADIDALKSIFEVQGADLFFSESPTNPLIRVVDTPAITSLCAKHGVISVIDTTFATPVNYRPTEHGADLVLHSGTKYLAGHHDVLCGALAGRAELVEKVRKLHGVLGGVIDPHTSFLINRGMKTLDLRMQAHNHNAETIATALEKHPKVSKVHYPTLESHVDYETASRLFDSGFGGVFSFEIRGDGNPWSRETFEATGRFVDALKIPYIGPSLGGCESIVEQVCIMGYFDQPLRERERLGINNGLIRYAAGIENADDLLADIEQALERA